MLRIRRLLICDEPVSSLDVSIRAQIMNLFLKLRDELGMACLLIAHDLAVVRQAAQRVYVMYLGKVMEEGESGRSTVIRPIPTPRPCSAPCQD